MKNILKITILFALLTLVLLTTVSCKNILGDLLGGNEENTTPEITTQPHAHAFGEWTTTQNATCTEKGQQERICACGEKELQEMGALGHKEVVDTAVGNSCTTDGLTAGSHCSVCGEVFTAQEVIPAEHNWMQLTLLEPATCFTYGEERRSCRVCGVVENAPIPPLAHDFVKNDETQTHICSLCNGVVFAGHLYAAFEGEYHWFDAYELCEEMGGHLATITSAEEQAVITHLISSELCTDAYYLIGGIRLSNGFHWVTEEVFEYTNWIPGQPDFVNQNQHFILIYSPLKYSHLAYYWEDCDYHAKISFICEWELNITECEHTFTEWEIITEATCWNDGEQYRICTYCGTEETEVLPKVEHNFAFVEETGMTTCEHCNGAKYNEHIYVLFADETSWFEAYGRCEALGGHLATITSEEEQMFVTSYLRANNCTSKTWLGGYSDGKQWHWVTDELFDYTSWGQGEPSNGGGREWFMELNYDNNWQWNDISLMGLRFFICEFECEE